MRRLAPILVVLTMIVAFAPADRAQAQSCRPAPWFRDFDSRSFPIVCGDWLGWPRYYYFAMGMRHRHHDRSR